MKCWLNLSKDCEELVLNECSTVGGQTSFLQSWEHKEQMNAETAEHKLEKFTIMQNLICLSSKHYEFNFLNKVVTWNSTEVIISHFLSFILFTNSQKLTKVNIRETYIGVQMVTQKKPRSQ